MVQEGVVQEKNNYGGKGGDVREGGTRGDQPGSRSREKTGKQDGLKKRRIRQQHLCGPAHPI